MLDLSQCKFKQLDEWRVRVSGTRGKKTPDIGLSSKQRSQLVIGQSVWRGCDAQHLISRLDQVLEQLRGATHKRVEDRSLRILASP